MAVETIFIAPGNAQCCVYAIPYQMRMGQKPGDILPQYRDDWVEIGLLNFQLKLVCLEPAYADWRHDIEGQMGGTFFEVERSSLPEAREARKPAEDAP
jgi:hypothetical protein